MKHHKRCAGNSVAHENSVASTARGFVRTEREPLHVSELSTCIHRRLCTDKHCELMPKQRVNILQIVW